MYKTTAFLTAYAPSVPAFLPRVVVYWGSMSVLGNGESLGRADGRAALASDPCEWTPELRAPPLCPFRRR